MHGDTYGCLYSYAQNMVVNTNAIQGKREGDGVRLVWTVTLRRTRHMRVSAAFEDCSVPRGQILWAGFQRLSSVRLREVFLLKLGVMFASFVCQILSQYLEVPHVSATLAFTATVKTRVFSAR